MDEDGFTLNDDLSTIKILKGTFLKVINQKFGCGLTNLKIKEFPKRVGHISSFRRITIGLIRTFNMELHIPEELRVKLMEFILFINRKSII
jgi:hypothetical protein